ncbi:MAG: endolytic transglycosylase MltG [Oscillospiraceae bacterium]|nr:endolytic transglycosylase MltG [Oscillospiraceae bacterium]
MARSQKGRKYVSGFLMFCLVIMLAVLALLVGAFISYSYVKNAQANLNSAMSESDDAWWLDIPPERQMYFEVPLGASTSAIASRLEDAGLIDNQQIFKIMSKVNGYDGLYKPGTHIVSMDLGYEELMMVLINRPEIIKVMIPEGVFSSQVYDLLIKSGLTNAGGVKEVVNKTEFDYEFLKGLPKRPDPLEGYLFPDTYEFDLGAQPEDIVAVMLRNFSNRVSEEYYERAEELGMTMDQIITLASIIEREAKDEEDRFVISGIFHNRLNSADAGMRRLQSCATVQYVFFKRNGIMLRTISDSDTRVADPYNTYQNEGLPPGPIGNPGLSSIRAALYPAETEYFFFVARGDGTHEFSNTYEEHLEAVQIYGRNLMS